MNPPFLPPPTRAAKSCSLNTTKSRNTIPTRTKSPTKKSCSRPMCRRSMQTAILYGTLPKRRKNNGTPSLPGGSCLPSQAAKRRAWGGNPNKIPIGQNERLAKFGTVVESCSKKLRCVVSSLTIRLSGAGLLRSGENFSWNFLIPLADGAGILPKLRKHFSP